MPYGPPRRAEAVSVLCGKYSSTLRRVLEYFAESTLPRSARRLSAFRGGMGELRKSLPLPEKRYALINFTVNSAWKYGSSRTAVESLENAMRRNPEMRLFFGSGLYDLVTVAGNVRYTLNQSRLPLSRVTVKEYRSGHMPYLGEETAAQLEADLRAFIR